MFGPQERSEGVTTYMTIGERDIEQQCDRLAPSKYYFFLVLLENRCPEKRQAERRRCFLTANHARNNAMLVEQRSRFKYR